MDCDSLDLAELQRLIYVTKAGTIINLAEGTYTGKVKDLTVDRPLTLRGRGVGKTKLDCFVLLKTEGDA